MLHLLVLVFLVFMVVRLILRPFRYACRRGAYGYRDNFYNPYRYGCRRRYGAFGGWLPILAIVALERLFPRRF